MAIVEEAAEATVNGGSIEDPRAEVAARAARNRAKARARSTKIRPVRPKRVAPSGTKTPTLVIGGKP